MKLERSERLFVEDLIQSSINENLIEQGAIHLERLAGDASTRRYYRARVGDALYVACLDNPINTKGQRNEFVRVQEVLDSNEIRVPRIIDKSLKKGFLLEEDLGDVTFLRELSNIDNVRKEEALFKKAVDLLIKIHNVDISSYSNEPFAKMSFDYNKLFDEILFTKKYFFETFLKATLDSESEKVFEEGFSKICEILAKEKMVLTHRDYHSRNLMVKNKELCVIDFQDARLGIPQYDLVSLLEDAYYCPSLELKQIMKTYYYDNFIAKKGFQSREQFDYLYDLMTIQRIFKAIGSFCYIHNLRDDIRYLKYIGRCFEVVRKKLFNLKEFNGLAKLLSTIYYEN